MNSDAKKVVYYFCCDTSIDPVAGLVYSILEETLDLKTLPIMVDDYPVKVFTESGNTFVFVRTSDVISHNYDKYLPIMNKWFGDFDFAGVVNWHEGKNAPDWILTVHTTGDIISGHFGPANPLYTRNLMIALEENRLELGLETFSVMTEATHWSGIVYGGNPESIPEYRVPVVDIEIGSSPESWSNPAALETVARSLTKVIKPIDDEVISILCIGGVHIEPSFSSAVLSKVQKIAVSHILANHWLVAGDYDEESGIEKLELCANSIIDRRIDAIIYHKSIKSVYKKQAQLLGEKLGVPVFKHKDLAGPLNLSF